MMERAAFIIKKLNQLVNDNARADILLANANLLVSELQQVQESNEPRSISVTIPKRNFIVEETHKPEEVFIKEEEIVVDIPAPSEDLLPVQVELLKEQDEKPTKSNVQQTYLFNIDEQEPVTPFRTKEEYVLQMPEEEPAITITNQTPIVESTNNASYFDIADIPTLPKAEEPELELNKRLAKVQTDINDTFKDSKVEVAHLHDNSHVKDLKRAISINEKYLFINNLFGRNEDLYDKSIKHIQNFSILAEATFWVQKELKTKLGWAEEDEVVQLFDQFVRRRFS